MAVRKQGLKHYLIQLRRIKDHREQGAERNIRRTYKLLVKDLQELLGVQYAELAEDDRLTYDILQRKGEYARFLEEVVIRMDKITPKVSREINKVVEGTYKAAYQGMVDAVEQSQTIEELHEMLNPVRSVTVDMVKRAVNNPIAGLTLKDTLEKNRKNVIYNVKQQIGIGMTQGDRMSTMANRITKQLDMGYNKSIRIVRTEVHRVQEAGLYDAAVRVSEELHNADTGLIYTKTWRTMGDESVRPQERYKGVSKSRLGVPNHVKMDGITLRVEEKFDLGGGISADVPGSSGNAGDDINCRCFIEYDLVEAEKSSILVNSGSGALKRYTEDEIIEMSQNAENTVNSYVRNDSKWSGKTIIKEGGTNIVAGKEWNCDISVERKTAMHILTHEHTHAHSVSYFSPDDYLEHQLIEEASVELLTKEIGKNQGYEVLESGYDDMVIALRKINKKIVIGNTDLEFAQQLITVPMVDRLQWLEEKVQTAMKNSDISEFIEMSELLKTLYQGG